MSVLTKSAIVIAGVLAGSYAIGRVTSVSIATEIEIDAPPGAVWAVLSDTEQYPDWNPFMRSMAGDLAAGNTLEVTLKFGHGSPQRIAPTVLVANADQELRWIGRVGVPGIFDGEHHFILEERADGATGLFHGETFSGILAYPVMAFMGADTERGFTAMNVALKERVEAGS